MTQSNSQYLVQLQMLLGISNKELLTESALSDLVGTLDESKEKDDVQDVTPAPAKKAEPEPAKKAADVPADDDSDDEDDDTDTDDGDTDSDDEQILDDLLSKYAANLVGKEEDEILNKIKQLYNAGVADGLEKANKDKADDGEKTVE